MFPKLSLTRQTYLRKLKQKKFRRLESTFICEGFRLFDAAVQTPEIKIPEIIISADLMTSRQGRFISEEARRLSVPIYQVSPKIMKSISGEVTPPGLLFTVRKPLLTQEDIPFCKSDLILYLDRIADPGNLGTIIRTSVWFGVNDIVLSPGCVDPHNLKTVRASAGALFNINIYEETEFNFLSNIFKKRNYQFIATAVEDGIPLEHWTKKQKCIIFFGQEASGLSAEILAAAELIIKIQRLGNVESLNLSVAAGIILHHVTTMSSGVIA